MRPFVLTHGNEDHRDVARAIVRKWYLRLADDFEPEKPAEMYGESLRAHERPFYSDDISLLWDICPAPGALRDEVVAELELEAV